MGAQNPDLHIVGVRHHSPACARLVEHTIRTVRPSYVLIEGPSDMNGRVSELMLPHSLPIAVFSFHEGAGSWSPFCEYSPEWQALLAARSVGAEPRFIDLPAWHPALHGVENRYGDHERRYDRAIETLCARLSVDGFDALWDHLFEGTGDGDAALTELAAKLATYFVGLRGDAPGGPRDAPREAFMRLQIAEALRRGGPVVVVCGGFHAPALADVTAAEVTAGAGPPTWPEVPTPGGAGSYLVPWSYHRLDSFTGYAAGMPSPGFYDAVFTHGPRAAIERMLRVAVEHLRHAGQHVSAADLVAAMALAEGLARLRGHALILRSDLLDGLAAALVKDALMRPLPWLQRAVVHRDTHPMIVALLEALSGSRRGRLHPATPMPPLVADVERELARCGLTPGAHARAQELVLAEPHDVERSRVLHRLRVLGIPGFSRLRGPSWASQDSAERPIEVWKIAAAEDAPTMLIEASRHGPTLAAAAGAKLTEALAVGALDLTTLTHILTELVLVGIDALTERALSLVREHIERESDLGALGGALALLIDLFGGDVLYGARKNDELGQVMGLAYLRGVWLLEQTSGQSADAGVFEALIRAVVALRDAARRAALTAANTKVYLDPELLVAVCERVAQGSSQGDSAAPAIRGACLGSLWSLGRLDDGNAAAVAGVRRLGLASQVGDFLAGLFALARDQTAQSDDVLRVIDEVLAALGEHDFLAALPSLRLAFAWFPPRERATIAERIASLHGHARDIATDLMTLTDDPLLIARGAQLDSEVEVLIGRYALGADA